MRLNPASTNLVEIRLNEHNRATIANVNVLFRAD